MLKKPDAAGLEARALCPALTPLSSEQGATLTGFLVWCSRTSRRLRILMWGFKRWGLKSLRAI